LKILQINTFDIKGGAARAAYRLHSGLRGIGADCRMISKSKSSTDENVLETRVGNAEETFKEAFYLSAIQRYYIDAHRTGISNTIFSLAYPGIDLSMLSEVAEAEIINLHWVAWYQSPVTLNKLFSLGKPVVWTLHDQWAFTGGCHYSASCRKYRADCSHCPQLADDPFDLSAAILKDKFDLFRKAKLTIVTPSRWLASCAKESALFRDSRVEVIPNSLETDIFAPVPKAEAKGKLGIKAEEILLLFGAEQGNEKRKGFPELVAAMQQCMADATFRDLAGKGMVKILCFGNASREIESIGLPVVSLGYLTEDQKIRDAYSAADLFVLPSLEDNLPNTMLEALSCATPVVAFSTGGIPDVVIEGETGLLAPTGDSAALGRAICALIADPRHRSRMGKTGRKRMVERHSPDIQAKKYLKLYEELIGKTSRSRVDTLSEGSYPSSAVIDTELAAHFNGIYDGVQVKALREAAPAIQKQLTGCSQEKSERETRIQKLNVEVRQADDQIKERNTRIVQFEQQIKDKDKLLETAQLEVSAEDEFYRQVSGQRDRLEKELADARLEISAKDELYRQVSGERERLEKELAAARIEISAKDELYNQVSREKDRLEKELADARLQISVKDASYKQLSSEKDRLEKELADARLQISAKDASYKQLSSEKDRLGKELADARLQISAKDASYKQLSSEEDRLEKELADAKRYIDQLLNSLSWKITKPLRTIGSKLR
jgi:glycosyltransferase involved in cell wall biosynthesis